MSYRQGTWHFCPRSGKQRPVGTLLLLQPVAQLVGVTSYEEIDAPCQIRYLWDTERCVAGRTSEGPWRANGKDALAPWGYSRMREESSLCLRAAPQDRRIYNMDEVSSHAGRGVLINTILFTHTVFIADVHLQGPGVSREVNNALRNIWRFVSERNRVRCCTSPTSSCATASTATLERSVKEGNE
jgi:hypothetical protein